MSTIRNMNESLDNIQEEVAEIDESTKAYAASLEKIANDKKLKNISNKDREMLAKIADMMKNANEEVEFDINEAFEALDENLRSDIAKVASKYPEGSSVKVKGKSAKVVSHGKDFLVVSAGKETMNVDLKDVVKESVELEEAKGYKEIYKKKIGKATVNVYQYDSGEIKAMFQGHGETSFGIKKFDKGIIDKALKHFDDNQGLLGSSMDKIAESTDLEEARIDAADYTVGAEKTKKGYRGQVTHTAKGHTMYLAGKVFKDEKDAKAHAKAYLDAYARGGDRVAEKDADNFVKRNSSKLAEEVIAEDYFTVQYYDAKGKAEEGKYKDFKDEKSAKMHLDRANKVVKDGEYKMFKVKGSMDESAELDEASYKVPKNYAAMMAKKAKKAKKDKPYEKQIGMGDSRSEKEIRDQISGLSDDTLKQWANDPAGRFGSKIAKLQDKLVATELKKRGIVESVSESVELEEHIRKNAQNTIKGNKYDMNENSYGLTASLIAAVTGVVTGVEAVDAPPAQEPKPVELEEGAEGGTGDKEAYQKFFQAALKKFGASSPADLDDKKKKEFYDYVDANWKGDNEVAEEALVEFKADGEDSEIPDPVTTKKDKKVKDSEEKKGGEKVVINPKLDEAPEMTDAQMKKREEIVLSMKDKAPEFKKKYGDRWKDVMYATATKLAMKENTK